jgi:hypothetical protein
MNIIDMFRGTPPVSPSVPAQNLGPDGKPIQQQQLGPDGNPLVPGATNTPPQDQDVNKSPLAEFGKLWDTEPLKEGQQPKPDLNDPNSIVPNLQIDPKRLSDAAKRIDFSRVIDQELAKKALGGDVAAFSQVINSVAQASFANMSMVSSRIVENALRQFTPKLLNESLPHSIRKFSVGDALVSSNKIFNDPAVAPMLEMLKSQLQIKYPQASTKEIGEIANRYMQSLAKAVGGEDNNNPNDPNRRGAVKEMDWIDDFLGGASAQK